MQVIQTNKPDFASLLQPALHHQSPSEVLNDPDLEPFEKRAILSSWAADICTVKDLRDASRSFHSFDDILDALCVLDSECGLPDERTTRSGPRSGRKKTGDTHSSL